MAKLERTFVDWMMDLISKFSKAAELVVNTCIGNMATAKAFMQLRELRQFAGCEKDSACFRTLYRL